MIRLSTVLMLGLIALASGVLFHISYEVQSLEDELGGLNREITHQQDSIRVLHAEWAYLNQPSRLRTLADRLSGLEPVRPDQLILTAAELPLPLPGAAGTPLVMAAATGQTAAGQTAAGQTAAGQTATGQGLPPTLASLPIPLRKPGSTAAPAAAATTVAAIPATGPAATVPAATATPAANLAAAPPAAAAVVPAAAAERAPARTAAPAAADRAPAQAAAPRTPATVPSRPPLATVPAARGPAPATPRAPVVTARAPAPADPIAMLLVNLRAQDGAPSTGVNR